MRESWGTPLRAAGLTAFIGGLIWLLLNPPSLSGVDGLVTVIGAALALVLVTAWLTVLAIGREMPEADFRQLEDRSEELAMRPPPEDPLTYFDELVIEALDELPEEFHRALEQVPVVVSNRGREHRAYGHYMGDTIARDNYTERIVIYQDTLERDFGRDPELLRAQVRRTVRHEVAHHLGWGERGVRDLGL
jgi:predicted Zn-dependent protease with MMP-like domain